MKHLKLFEEFNNNISEDLKYHISLSLDRIQGNLENLKQEVAHLLNTLYDKAKIQSLCQFPFLMHPINSLY